MIFLIIYTILMTALFCYLRTQKNQNVTLVTKILASMGFVTLAVFSSILAKKSFSLVHAYLIMGTLFGMIGDIVLDIYYSKNENFMLISGMASFTIGHIFYILSMLQICERLNYTVSTLHVLYALSMTIILSLITILSTKIMKFDFGKAFIPTTIYTVVLNFVTVFSWVITAFNPKIMILSIGLTLFLLSDLVLSIIYFGGKRKSNLLQVVNHILYYASQLLIVLTMFRI